METNDLSYLPSKTFYTTERIRFLIQAAVATILALFFILLALLVLLHRQTQQYNWKTAGILGIVGVCFLLISTYATGASRTRITLSPDGIELDGFGYRIFSKWENIHRIDIIPQDMYPLNPGRQEKTKSLVSQTVMIEKFKKGLSEIAPESHLEGLVLREGVPHVNEWWGLGRVKQTWFISLNLFRWWRYSELGKMMRLFAPHLFED